MYLQEKVKRNNNPATLNAVRLAVKVISEVLASLPKRFEILVYRYFLEWTLLESGVR
jgi:hypothetical protein